MDDFERVVEQVQRVQSRRAFTREEQTRSFSNAKPALSSQTYFYYEGKGIYCIALSKGLNLLCVSRDFVHRSTADCRRSQHSQVHSQVLDLRRAPAYTLHWDDSA
ncbi:hypothetical protein FRC12_022679, partial [Ceratobasidium sp. 428]